MKKILLFVMVNSLTFYLVSSEPDKNRSAQLVQKTLEEISRKKVENDHIRFEQEIKKTMREFSKYAKSLDDQGVSTQEALKLFVDSGKIEALEAIRKKVANEELFKTLFRKCYQEVDKELTGGLPRII